MRRFLAVVAVALLASVVTACASTPTSPSATGDDFLFTSSAVDDLAPVDTTHTVRYLIGGTAVKASEISWSTAGFGIAQKTGAELPWSKKVKFDSDTIIATVNAQNGGKHGTITCEIDIDGVQVAANESSGAYAVVQCTASQ